MFGQDQVLGDNMLYIGLFELLIKYRMAQNFTILYVKMKKKNFFKFVFGKCVFHRVESVWSERFITVNKGQKGFSRFSAERYIFLQKEIG